MPRGRFSLCSLSECRPPALSRYQSHITVIRFRLLIQKIKDTGSSRKSHNNRVDLLRYLVDITGKLFRHIQERNDNTDPQHLSGKAYVGYVARRRIPPATATTT